MAARRFLSITLRFTDRRPDETYRVAAIELIDGRLRLTLPSGDVFDFAVEEVFNLTTELGLMAGA